MLHVIQIRLLTCIAAFFLICGDALFGQALASVQIRISLSRQSMNVNVDGAPYATWPISTGREGYGTPAGTFRPQSMHKMHYSRRYNMTPMPHSIFFYYGFAIHGTSEVRRLGRPASHGCIRLSPQNARALYSLVGRHGMSNTSITVTY
ncbi:L,D-transpeptidase [Pseudorhodoplanes sp.]|jgi:lipoprotein-anchoring transpeptidase ErfK/SrfK|uniref:L,D-transpeptidase n=1 Tax=Pseudorhodoplanes sp. TaxID=1934341 RepID=UPI002C3EE0BA|nr:L,D-transpeptidase [Pseudorhodoplanes sp.]HWV42950.1 L,D-transpeptidase [Pseudorhodoplanes sp.]